MLKQGRKAGRKRAVATAKQAHGLLTIATFGDHPQAEIDRSSFRTTVGHPANHHFN
jgi:hypothetical protein